MFLLLLQQSHLHKHVVKLSWFCSTYNIFIQYQMKVWAQTFDWFYSVYKSSSLKNLFYYCWWTFKFMKEQSFNSVINSSTKGQIQKQRRFWIDEDTFPDLKLQTVTRGHSAAQQSPSPLVLSLHEVRWILQHISPKKAAGPDGVPGWVLKHCAG